MTEPPPAQAAHDRVGEVPGGAPDAATGPATGPAQSTAPASPPAAPPSPAPRAEATPRAASRPPARRSVAPASKRRPGLREAITRRLLGSDSPPPRAPAAGRPLDTAAAAEIAQDLLARGISEAFARQLIAGAAAHGGPLGGDGLRDAARDQLARLVLQPPSLPAGGAAVAFVGAGGAGKTSCAAALASAYARTSTLATSAFALRPADGGQMLTGLLRDDRVDVTAVEPERLPGLLAARRSGGFLVVDTPAVFPGDAKLRETISDGLAALALDAMYVMLPATLGAHAAGTVLAWFAPLRPTAVVITHADETDQLGIAVELAAMREIPLAYVHAGTDPRSSLRAVRAQALARELLP